MVQRNQQAQGQQQGQGQRRNLAPYGNPVGNHGNVDISDPMQQQQSMQQSFPQRPAAQVAEVRVNLPQDISMMFVRTTVEQRLLVTLGVAYALKNDTMQKFGVEVGNKFVTIYSILRTMREQFGNIPIEMSVVQDCLDTLIHKGIVRKFDNTEATTNDGQRFYAIQYGLSRAAWDLVNKYGVEVPQWRVAGTEFDPNNQNYNPRQTAQRYNGIRNNFANQNRANDVITL